MFTRTHHQTGLVAVRVTLTGQAKYRLFWLYSDDPADYIVDTNYDEDHDPYASKREVFTTIVHTFGGCLLLAKAFGVTVKFAGPEAL
jgi:hypothetical protein